MMPATFSQRLSRPSRQALQVPQVSAPYITTGSPALKPVTPAPTAAISPAASAPTTSGSLRLANAMPRKPQRSRWLSATALIAICTSPAAGRRRGRDVGQLELAVGEQRAARASVGGHAGSRPITSETFCPPKPNELEMAWRTLASRATFGTTSSGIAGIGHLVVDGRRDALVLRASAA